MKSLKKYLLFKWLRLRFPKREKFIFSILSTNMGTNESIFQKLLIENQRRLKLFIILIQSFKLFRPKEEGPLKLQKKWNIILFKRWKITLYKTYRMLQQNLMLQSPLLSQFLTKTKYSISKGRQFAPSHFNINKKDIKFVPKLLQSLLQFSHRLSLLMKAQFASTTKVGE